MRCGVSGKRCNDVQRANIPHQRPVLPALRTSLRSSHGDGHHFDDRASPKHRQCRSDGSFFRSFGCLIPVFPSIPVGPLFAGCRLHGCLRSLGNPLTAALHDSALRTRLPNVLGAVWNGSPADNQRNGFSLGRRPGRDILSAHADPSMA